MNRREFLKTMGLGSLAVGAVASGCTNPNQASAEGGQPGEVPVGKMTYRAGSHGEKVSLLGFGCMRLPSLDGKSGREAEQQLDQQAVDTLFDYAIGHGVNLFDTAPPYCKGQSEEVVGRSLSRHSRSEYMLSTKLSNMKCNTWSREASIAMYRNSMAMLHTDYLDFYMLHCVGTPGRDELGNTVSPMDTLKHRFFDNGILDFLIEERAAGRIRNLGFSFHGDVAVFDYLLSLHPKVHWDHVLIQHNYIDWGHAQEYNEEENDSHYLYSELEKRAIPVFVMEPLLGGQLATLSEHATQELKTLQPQRSIASWAFRFAGQQPRILTVLSGMTYMEHLQDNIRTYSPLEPLSDTELQALDRVAVEFANFQSIPCTGCKYCMPCPYGLDIPSIFAHFNRCLNEGSLVSGSVDDLEGGEERRAYRKARREYLVGYDRSVPRLRQADQCIGCNHCLAECPQGIDIPSQMRRIDTYTEELRTSLL